MARPAIGKSSTLIMPLARLFETLLLDELVLDPRFKLTFEALLEAATELDEDTFDDVLLFFRASSAAFCTSLTLMPLSRVALELAVEA